MLPKKGLGDVSFSVEMLRLHLHEAPYLNLLVLSSQTIRHLLCPFTQPLLFFTLIMPPVADSKLYSVPEAASSSSSSTVHSPLPPFKIEDDYDFGRRPSDFELNDLFHDEEPLLSEDIEAVREKEQEQQLVSRSSSSAMKSTFWTLVNVVATVLIVYLFHLFFEYCHTYNASRSSPTKLSSLVPPSNTHNSASQRSTSPSPASCSLSSPAPDSLSSHLNPLPFDRSYRSLPSWPSTSSFPISRLHTPLYRFTRSPVFL